MEKPSNQLIELRIIAAKQPVEHNQSATVEASHLPMIVDYRILLLVGITFPILIIRLLPSSARSDNTDDSEVDKANHLARTGPTSPEWDFIFGFLLKLVLTTYCKVIIARPRPNFYEICQPTVTCDAFENRFISDFMANKIMIKLSEPADLSEDSNIRTICLPFRAFGYPQSMDEELHDQTEDDTVAIPIRDNNFLRNIRIKQLQSNGNHSAGRRQPRRSHTRRNDKFLHGNLYTDDAVSSKASLQDLPYTDCIATGWGRSSTSSGDLADTLLQTKVPIHTNVKCKNAYGSNVKIHKGHLCAGKLNGKGGTCVGDSGGPLQCRLSKNGPWLLAGITSFGSGCAEQGYPDVYTRISFYIKWISDTISQTSDGS